MAISWNSAPAALNFERALESAKPGLRSVEDRIKSLLGSDASQLTEIAGYLLQLGGKRIRPLVAVLSARLFGMASPDPKLIDAAAGIELIHMATLLHDDIIDESPTRRHKTSAFVKFGITPSLLAGDFLLVKAFGLCARLDRFVIEETEKACVELTEGEVLEGRIFPGRTPSVEDYLDIVGKKTASLFSLAASLGAHLGGASRADVDAMYRFGRAAGIAFQMIDDILDITATDEQLGKPAGTDLKQKTPSLVNILWLAEDPKRALEFFAKDVVTIDEAKEIVGELKNSTVIRRAKRHAEQHAAQAEEALSQLSGGQIHSQDKALLNSLVAFTLERCL